MPWSFGRRERWAFAAALCAALLAVLLGLGACSSSPPSSSPAVPDSSRASAASLPASPLPDCPGTPNCEHVSRPFPASPDALFDAAQQALAALGPTTLEVEPAERRAHAVYRVALVFKDDVVVAVTSDPATDGGAVLHVRSASRVGHSDLGVNGRRVRRFFDRLREALGMAASG
jgi:uncharacterized protein (DUF1499 family)